MIRAALPLIALATMACSPIDAPPAQTPPARAPTTCGAEKIADLVGKQRSDAVAADAKARSGAARLRWIAPDTMVTMDYSETRLNLYTDATGRITDIRCG